VRSQLAITDNRLVGVGSSVKKIPSKLTFHPFPGVQTDKSAALRLGGDKSKQQSDAQSKEKETSAQLLDSLQHIFLSPITEGMRVQSSATVYPRGAISFGGHTGDWFQPRRASDFNISLEREIQDSLPGLMTPVVSPQKIVALDKLLDKAEKTLRRNGSVLICGGRGAGKSAVLNELSHRMSHNLTCPAPPSQH
jgi:hypothetical protein